MTKSDNIIGKITDIELEGQGLVKKAREKAVKEFENARKVEEAKKANLKKDLSPQIEKILSLANAKVNESVTQIKKESNQELEKISNISEDKKSKAINLIVQSVIS